MRRVLFLLICGCLFAGGLRAAPPRCKTVEQDGRSVDVCERPDIECESLAKEQVRNPSSQWNGWSWPALIMKTRLSVLGLVSFVTHVTVVASYGDSERMDVTVTIEQADHTYRKYVRKDVPVIIRNDIPSATVEIASLDEPVGVPTADAIEKGGKKEASWLSPMPLLSMVPISRAKASFPCAKRGPLRLDSADD
jgi:hypothetical protein